jgi:hypothetical protein
MRELTVSELQEVAGGVDLLGGLIKLEIPGSFLTINLPVRGHPPEPIRGLLNGLGIGTGDGEVFVHIGPGSSSTTLG